MIEKYQFIKKFVYGELFYKSYEKNKNFFYIAGFISCSA